MFNGVKLDIVRVDDSVGLFCECNYFVCVDILILICVACMLWVKWLFTWVPLLMTLGITNFMLAFPIGYFRWDLEKKLCQFLRTFLYTRMITYDYFICFSLCPVALQSAK